MNKIFKLILFTVCFIIGGFLGVAVADYSKPDKFTIQKQGEFYLAGYDSSESRKRVVVVDSGLAPEFLVEPYMCRDVAHISPKTGLQPHGDHGTKMVNIITKGMDVDKYCITMFRADKNDHGLFAVAQALKHLASDSYLNPHIISMSMVMKLYNLDFHRHLSRLLSQSTTKINVAAGNDGMDLNTGCVIYAACYAQILRREGISTRNLKVVGAIAEYSNHGQVVDLFLPVGGEETDYVRGTSAATALYTNMMVRK